MALEDIGSIADIIRSQASERPEAAALEIDGELISFGELDRRSSIVANALASVGVGDGDRVAFIDKNGLAWFEVTFGLAKIGAVNVSVNWRLAPTEMAQIINDAQAEVVIVGPDFVEHIEKVEQDLATVRTIISLAPHARWLTYDEWLAGRSDEDPGREATPDDIAFQLYTSGTTGLPKGVMLSNTNFFQGLPGVAGQWQISADSVSMAMMPMFHIAGAGWAMIGLAHGCRTVVLRDIDPAAILRAVGESKVTNAFIVPAVIQVLLVTPGVDETDFTSLRTVVYGASPITDTVLVRAMETFGCEFVQVYGATETTGAITQLAAADHDPIGKPALLRSCGKPYPWVEMRVVDAATGEDKPVGEVGELWTRSHQNHVGYWNNPKATAEATDAEGWFHTGDAGFFDDEGYVYLHDRVKDMIVTGGENVYPAEVENVLMGHPAVADVAVIGIPNERWGEAVHAIVVPVTGTDPSDAELITYAREHLAGYKLPKSVTFTDVLPRNPSGKLLKRELREPYWADVERRIG